MASSERRCALDDFAHAMISLLSLHGDPSEWSSLTRTQVWGVRRAPFLRAAPCAYLFDPTCTTFDPCVMQRDKVDAMLSCYAQAQSKEEGAFKFWTSCASISANISILLQQVPQSRSMLLRFEPRESCAFRGGYGLSKSPGAFCWCDACR